MGYSVAVYDLPPEEPLPEMKPKGEKKTPLAYLSYVDGKLEQHATWPECERRVKGRQGAKFKKVFTEDEMTATLRSWGVSR
jgi:ribonuclease HI